MSDNIPFEIQMEIIKRLPVKPLIQFRSVSKPWKSFIDSSDFIKGYGARHTQPRSYILRYRVDSIFDELRYFRLVEDDSNETFKVQQELAPFVVSLLLKQYIDIKVVGACHGLLCLYCYDDFAFETLLSENKEMVVIWNPSIRKSFGIAVVCDDNSVFGFGVCPVTCDPTVVKIIQTHNNTYVEVFTLSSGVWNVIPSGNLPRKKIRLDTSTQVVIDRFIYWAACDTTFVDGVYHDKYMVASFDLITKEFKLVDIHLPDSLTNKPQGHVPMSISKLRESLVVYGSINVEGVESCGVWVMMQHDSSFKKLFSIGAQVDKILRFRDSGEAIFETLKEDEMSNTLDVYDPCSQQINNLGIDGQNDTFFMGSYKESLLLLDHSDLHIFCDDN